MNYCITTSTEAPHFEIVAILIAIQTGEEINEINWENNRSFKQNISPRNLENRQLLFVVF